MSYEDIIGEFWKKAGMKGLDCTQIAVMMGLLHFWHRAGFPARCEVRNDELMRLLSVSKPTLTRARERLCENGLIMFEEGNGRKQPAYEFRVMDEESPAMPVSFEPVEVLPPEMVNVSERKVKRPQKSRKTAAEPSLMFKEEKPKKEKKVKKDDDAPSWAVVLMECRRKGMSDEEAKYFYDYYNAQGWHTTGGVKIKNIDSMVNRWLMTEKKKRDESDRRFVQQRGPSPEDNIREAQRNLIEEMSRFVKPVADDAGREVPAAVPDYK